MNSAPVESNTNGASMDALMQQWVAVQSRVNAMSLRERIILTGLLAMLLSVAFHLSFIGRLDAQRKLLRQQLEQATARNETLWTQAEAIRQAHLNDPNDRLRQHLAEMQADIKAAETQLGIAADELMQPRNIPLLLHNLVANQQGIAMKRVETLPVSMVDINGKVVTDAAGIEDGVLYRHGLEVEIVGSYQNLNRWMLTVEKVPGYIQWESMKYIVGTTTADSGSPQAKLILRLYTLSVHEMWLDE